MRKQKLTTATTAILGISSMVCLIICVLALHDIRHDYASPIVMEEFVRPADGSLPGWTACRLEWLVVGICLWPMVIFHALFIISLIKHAVRITREFPDQEMTARG